MTFVSSTSLFLQCSYQVISSLSGTLQCLRSENEVHQGVICVNLNA